MVKIEKTIWILLLTLIIGGSIIRGRFDEKQEELMYGFTVQNWQAVVAGFPSEDAFAFDLEGKVAAVSDLVTRDLKDGSVVNKEGLVNKVNTVVNVRLKGLYPDYSEASRDAVETFLDTKSLERVNQLMWSYNINHGLVPTNYLDKDLAGCTFAGAAVEDSFLYWKFIADSGIAIVGEDGSLRFKTPDEGPHSSEKNPHLEAVLEEQGGFINPEGRRIIRRDYRNNPNEPFAYGVLTGETTALPYIREGKEELKEGDYVLVFTDGVGDIAFFKDENGNTMINDGFAYELIMGNRRSLKRYCRKRVETEGTLVVWEME